MLANSHSAQLVNAESLDAIIAKLDKVGGHSARNLILTGPLPSGATKAPKEL